MALRLGRHVEGLVDSWTGDPAVPARVDAEPMMSPTQLAADAARLADDVRRGSERGELSAARAGVLLGRIGALEALARRLAGVPVSYAEEVLASFGVRPGFGDLAAYSLAHRELDGLLPGRGALGARLHAWRASVTCPPQRVAEVVAALAAELRTLSAGRWPLPTGEQVEWATVGRAPWAGSAHHLGAGRTRVAVSAGLRVRLSHLPALVAHEAYPGHHTAACRHDELLVRGRGELEHQVSVVLTPDALVGEGAAEHALAAACPGGWAGMAEAVYAGLGLGFDGALAERVTGVLAGLGPVRQDAALLLHGADGEPGSRRAAVEHLQVWGLMSPERARLSLEFLAHPLWRSYITTYVEGGRLVGGWLAARPVAMGATERYARLLDEALHPADLARELAAGR